VGDSGLSNFSNGLQTPSSTRMSIFTSKGSITSLSDGISFLNNTESTEVLNGDTLSNTFEPPFVCFKDQYQTEYEATKLVPNGSCTLQTLLYGFYNYENTERSKACEFYVWLDNGGKPGTELLSMEHTITLPADEARWVALDISEANLVINDAFWIGHREKVSGAPSSLSDTLATPNFNYYSDNGALWYVDQYDYLQMAVVSYEGEMTFYDSKIMTIYNTGNAPLKIDSITSHLSWVVSISDYSFTVAPEDSQNVKVTVNSQGLADGEYYGCIQITSNDHDNSETQVQLVFDVKTDVAEHRYSNLPTVFSLHQNLPNPFNPTTRISYSAPKHGNVIIRIFNTLGQEMKVLVDGDHLPGHYNVIWDGTDNSGNDVASGVYIYTLKTNEFIKSRKMILVR